MEKRNTTIDLAKYIASIMIVAIHTGVFSEVHETLSFVVVHVICRMAVPFFAVCSGYFLVSQMEFDVTLRGNRHNRAVFLKQWTKLVQLYGVWTILYLFYSIPMWIDIGWFSPFAFVDYAVSAVTKGSHYHFWYLWGMIYTLPLFYVFLRSCRRKYWVMVIVFLWGLKVMGYSYSSGIPKYLVTVLDKMGTLLCLLPLLLLGAVIRLQKQKSLQFYIIGLLLSLTGLAAEAFFLKSKGQDAVSYIIFTLPVAYFLFCSLLKVRMEKAETLTRKLGAVSLFIYCVHPMLVELTDDMFRSSLGYFCFVSAVSTALGFGYHYVRKKVKLCST